MTTPTPTRDYLIPHLMTLPPHRVMIRMIEARLFAETAPDMPEPILDVAVVTAPLPKSPSPAKPSTASTPSKAIPTKPMGARCIGA